MLDQSWSLLGDCTEMAVASDDVRFLMLEISEGRRADAHKPQYLSLLWLGDA